MPVILRVIAFMVVLLSIASCGDEPDNPSPVTNSGKIVIDFNHQFNNEELEFDTLRYINAAGNLILFSEIQYFISDVTLHYTDGSSYLINKWKDIHYVDSDIPSTMTWEVYDSIPVGNIDSISFIFGIDEAGNQSFMYVNPPESLMFWPDILGGGYHYMKINGKWLNPLQQLNPFNFHLGIGQIYDNENNITGFIQNFFSTGAVLPLFSSYALSIKPDQTSGIALVMNVESWFNTPDLWDFNYWGGDIMQNQAAMATACGNGKDAFTLSAPDFMNK